MRRFILMSLCLAGAVGCAPENAPATTVAIGAVMDRVGNNSEPSWEDSIRLAALHATAGAEQSGLFTDLGFRVEFGDNQNDTALAVNRATKLVRELGVKGLILDTSQVDVAVNELAYDADPGNDLNVPLQCGSCTSGTINNPNANNANNAVNQAALRNGLGWNFRSIMSTRLISKILVEIMLSSNGGDANNDGKFKISYIGSDEVFGRGTVNDLKLYANQLHTVSAPIIEEIYHPANADPNSYNWDNDLAQLLDNKTGEAEDGFPDVVVIANFAQQQASFVKAYRQNGTEIPLLHYHTFRISSALQSLGSLGDGVRGVSHVQLDNGDSGDIFARLYEEEYGVPVVYRDSIYYDNAFTMFLAAAIAAQPLADPTQVTGAQIRDALKRTSEPGGEVIRTGPDEFAKALSLVSRGQPINYEGASGPMDFDANGNIINRLAQYRAEGGRFVDVAKYDCVADPLCPVIPQ